MLIGPDAIEIVVRQAKAQDTRERVIGNGFQHGTSKLLRIGDRVIREKGAITCHQTDGAAVPDIELAIELSEVSDIDRRRHDTGETAVSMIPAPRQCNDPLPS